VNGVGLMVMMLTLSPYEFAPYASCRRCGPCATYIAAVGLFPAPGRLPHERREQRTPAGKRPRGGTVRGRETRIGAGRWSVPATPPWACASVSLRFHISSANIVARPARPITSDERTWRSSTATMAFSNLNRPQRVPNAFVDRLQAIDIEARSALPQAMI